MQPPVLGKEGGVDVDATQARDAEHGGAQKLAERGGHEKIEVQGAQKFLALGAIDGFGLEKRETEFLSGELHGRRGEPKAAARGLIRLGDDQKKAEAFGQGSQDGDGKAACSGEG